MKNQVQGRRIFVPLNKLFLSPLNGRKNDTTDVSELAALIRSQGLLQNLIVVPKIVDCEVVGHGVVGGGRRFRSMGLLVANGDLEHDHPVPCLEVDEADAEQASLAENSAREPMHPADEFEAFQRMHDAGTPMEDIAASFGVSPVVVQRRLKLASVSPGLIQTYRAGEIKLDQLMALAITDDHKVQERVWKDAEYWQRSPDALRAEINKGSIYTRDSNAARFVGIAAYEAAGGAVVRDLFSSRDDGYMADEALLTKLFNAKMEAEADKLRAEGWAWVEVKAEVSYSDVHKYGRSKPTERDLTAAEAAEIASLAAQIDSLQEKIEALEEDDEDEDTEAELDQQVDDLKARRAAIEACRLSYSERQMKKAGAIVGLNYDGRLTVHRGLIPPIDAKKVSSAAGGTASGDEPPQTSGPAHPEVLTRKLSAHRTAALQASLADCPKLAQIVLCYTLASQVLYSGGHYGIGALRISASQQTTSLTHHADDMEGSKAWADLMERRENLREQMPENPTELFGWLQEQTDDLVMEILAFCTASCVDAIQHNEGSKPGAELATTLGLDMAEWWQPTAKGYFRHLRKDTAIAIVGLVDGEQDTAKLAKLKKGEIDQQAEKALANTGWLPEILQAPEPPEPKPKKNHPPVRYRDSAGNTWTGRGKRPGWLDQAIKGGRTAEEFLIMPSGAESA